MAVQIEERAAIGGAAPKVDRVTNRDRTLFRLAALLAVTPIVSAAVLSGIAGWFPTRDAAFTTVWIRDVFSAHTPLHGQAMRFPDGAADVPYYLGVVHHYVLAVPVALFGVAWGLLIGMAVLNTTWVLLALWLIRRRVGYRFGLIGCATVTVLLWSLGSQMLMDPTPAQTAPLALFTCCVAAWSVADADPKALVPLGVTSSYLFTVHPQYVLVVPAVTALAAVVALVRLRKVRADDPDRWAQTRRSWLRGAVGAGAATVVLWLPALIDQVVRPGGNLRVWFASMLDQSGDSTKTLADVVRVVASPLSVPPFWFRDSMSRPGFTALGPTADATAQFVVLAVVGAVATATLVAARRRGDGTVVAGIVIGIVAWVAWVVTMYRQPGGLYNPDYLVTSWPLAAFLTLTVLLGVARSTWVRARLSAPVVLRRGGVLAAGTVGVFVLLAIPTADLGATTPAEDAAGANHIRRVIRERVEPGSPVLVVAPEYPARAFLPVAILELEHMGIQVRVAPGRETLLYRSFRSLDRRRPDAGRRLTLARDPLPPSPGRELIATCNPRFQESVGTHRERAHLLDRWAESTEVIRLAPTTPVDPDHRRFADMALSAMQAGAAANGHTIFGTLDYVDHLILMDDALIAEGDDLATALVIPGVTGTQLRDWLERQAVILGEQCLVYLEPL